MEARKRLAAALATTTVAALAWTSSAAACTGADLPASAQSEAQLEGTVLCLVNEQRSAAGVPVVRANSKLRDAGLGHAAEMVSQGYFAHTSPSGVGFIDRILDAGYMRGSRRWTVGENLVWGSGELSTPAALVNGWMESPPHRENLLRSRFRELGIAAVRGTPQESDDGEGITVASEYGYRGKKKSHKGRSAKASRRRG
jgi:uncharacterized protein YkwD